MGSLGGLHLEIWGLGAALLWFPLRDGILGYHRTRLQWGGGLGSLGLSTWNSLDFVAQKWGGGTRKIGMFA